MTSPAFTVVEVHMVAIVTASRLFCQPIEGGGRGDNFFPRPSCVVVWTCLLDTSDPADALTRLALLGSRMGRHYIKRLYRFSLVI